MTDKLKFIIERFGGVGINLNDEQGKRFLALFEYMVKYNRNVNLTSITEFEDVVIKHLIDSVLPFMRLNLPEGASFIDVGTGAGFPGLPLKIVRPDLRATLCDSQKKRCVYLESVCGELGVTAKIINERSEELGRHKRERFDYATARAVAALPVLTELCLPFVSVGGYFVALKSVNEDARIAENAITLLGGKLEEVFDYDLPNGDSRRLVVVKKISQTPTKYPRSFANITKKPL